MTDFLASTIASPIPDVGSAFDVTNLDASFREVSAVERSWRLPALPDAVKLDLISSPDVTKEGLGSFMRGVDSDFYDSDEAEAEPIPAPRVNLLDQSFGQSGWDQARIIAAGIAGQPEPTDPTIDAVKHFKMRAIEKGYLDASETGDVDSTWSPELNSIRGQMAFDDYNTRLRGYRPGAVSTNTAIDLLGKWTSPTGLLAAATELDLFWDFGAIGGEFNSWGDKWRKLDEAKNPFDFGAKLVDALTGPLDDIIIPAANWLLLGSGVGVVTNTARIGWMAGKTGIGAKFVRGLYAVTDVRSAANLASISEKSWMATRLSRGGSTASALGGAMSAWRAATPVRNTKAGVQLGMRYGFISQAEDLVPGYQGGLDLSQTPGVGAVNRNLRGLSQNPAAVVPEMLLSPYNIFSPGTFLRSGGDGLNLVSRTASGLLTVAGSTAGRAALGGAAGLGIGTVMGDDLGDSFTGALIGAGAAGAAPQIGELLGTRVGTHAGRSLAGAIAGAGMATLMDDDADALDVLKGSAAGLSLVTAKSAWNSSMRNGDGTGKYIGHVSDFLKHTSFQPLADDQRIAQTFHQGMLRGLIGPDRDRYVASFERHRAFKPAFAEYLGVDGEAAGAATAYVMASAAIDHTARVQAGFLGSEGSQLRYHLYRNKLIAQLRTFDLQNPTTATIRDIARAKAMEHVQNPHRFNSEVRRWESDFLADPGKALEYASQHNDVAAGTLRQLMSPENLPGFGRQTEVGSTADDGLNVIAEYLPQAMPTFGNWAQFDAITRQVDDVLHRGLLESATFKSATSRFGREMRGIRRKDIVPVSPISDGISQTLLDSTVDVAKTTKMGRFSVLAHVAPSGRFTVARKSTPTKQQILELSDHVQDLLEARADLDAIAVHGVDLAATAAGVTKIDSAQIRAVLKQSGATKAQKPVQRLLGFAQRRGISTSDLRVEVRRLIDEMADDVDLWRTAGLDEFVWEEVEGGGRVLSRGNAALDKRYRQLVEKERYTAAEIDVDSLISHYDETGQADLADEIRALAEGLDADDYKLVHGVEFLMPHDLAMAPAFEDISRRNTNFMTFGNFFKGRLPAEARMAEERRQRIALATTLQDRAAELSDDLGPESDAVTSLLASIRVVLEDLQETSRVAVDQLHNQNWWNRRVTAVQSSTTPLRVEDLLSRKDLVINKLREMGYAENVAEAAWLALPKFRNAEFRDLGIYSLEAKLRQRNEFARALKFLSGTKYGEQFGSVAATRQAVIGAGVGALADDASGDDGVMEGAALGALGGALSGVAAGKSIAKLVPRAEMSRYGYLGDTYARARDSLRFTLSPWFDISRFSEGYMLAQTAAPLRHADGSRIVMPLNASPSGIRKAIKKGAVDLEALGLDRIPTGAEGRQLDSIVRQRFDDIRGQFRAAARGDFDPEVLDSTGKWFAQVGIAGFNPTDWMATAFANLRVQGFSIDEAYSHARSMYTYGTRGRSAAELSVNAIFFPFSFQKKALTHIGKWMNDDLSRSIMIHDAFKAYEVLNEEYNLDEMWRDHLPALQQLNKLNLFAFGISPGRFGGINAQVLETGFKASAGLFTPQGFSITNAQEAAEVQDLYRSLMPAVNDINWMVQNLKEQGHVIASDSHQTTYADVSDGYREWNDYKSELSQSLTERGFTWSDLSNKAYLAPAKAAYDLKRAEISAKFPAWRVARDEAVYNAVALERERSDRLARAAADPASASVDDVMMARFELELENLKGRLKYEGIEVGGSEGWADAPPEVAQYITSLGVQMLREHPAWRRIHDKFYRRDFGVLEAQL